MMGCPAHTGLLKSTLDDLLVGTLNRTGPNRVTTALEIRVINHFETSLQVELGCTEHSGLFFPLGFRVEQVQFGQSPLRRLVFQLGGAAFEPALESLASFFVPLFSLINESDAHPL